MKFSINLLQETQKASTRIRRMGILLQSISMGILIGFSVIVLMIISYTVVVSSQRNRLQKQIEEEKLQIEQLKPVEVRQQLIKQKLKSISEIITEYGINYKIATDLFDFAANKITIGKIIFSESNENILLGGMADNVGDFTYFMDQISIYAKENKFKKVEIGEFSRNLEGKYSFEISISVITD